MGKIFIGFLLIFLDFNLTFDLTVIGLLPDFIGYFLLAGGLAEMAPQSAHFGKVKPFSILMAVYTMILYTLDLIGVTNSLGYFATALGLAATMISLFISFHIVKGIVEIERSRARNLKSAALHSAWRAMAVLNVLAYLLFFIPGLNIAGVLAGFIAGIIFLVGVYRTKKAYALCA